MKVILLVGIFLTTLDLFVKSLASFVTPNYGIIFGLFPQLGFISLVLSIIFLGFIFYWGRTLTIYGQIALGFLLGGTLGNLYDRLVFGYVRDFINFCVQNLCYPSFNLADVFLLLGFILLLFYSKRRSLGM